MLPVRRMVEGRLRPVLHLKARELVEGVPHPSGVP
jgi:hypothetical protein